MKQIRRSTFETNSSSTHSISFGSGCVNNLVVEDDGYVHASLGEFGWEIRSYNLSADKLSYLLTYLCECNGLTHYCSETPEEDIETLYALNEFKEIESCVVCNVANCKGLKVDSLDGYIDHQSLCYDSISRYLLCEGVDSIQAYLFGDVIVNTDNDNH